MLSLLCVNGNGSHIYELDRTQRLEPQGGNATILPPKNGFIQEDFDFLIRTLKNIKASKIKAFTNIGKHLYAFAGIPKVCS